MCPMAAEKKRPRKPTEQKPTGRARELGKTRLVTIEIDVLLDDALEAFRQADRRTKKAVVTMALEEFLAKHGHWPPRSTPSPDMPK
jgi:hypothetical protein